jgi:asparagine synthetase B (glutamine-hydrolysing)
MCGIVGLVGSFSREQCIDILRRMNAAIVHRAPDDEGIWAEDGFGFAMPSEHYRSRRWSS